MRTLRLGTRGSRLALTQSRWVAAALGRTRDVRVALEVIRTKGDRTLDRPLPEIGGKGLFTAELDRALLDGDVDLAVHSLKDLPTGGQDGLRIACIPEREDPRDVVVGPRGPPTTLAGLPEGATVGTSSLRRRAFLRAFHGGLRVESVRGNLDTRIRRVDEGLYDAVLVAAAGVRRLGLSDRVGEWLERTAWLPAPGQGALAVVTRAEDEEASELLGPLHDEPTAAAVGAERSLLERLEGGCQVPLGALGLPYEGGLRLWGLVASPDGRRAVRADLTGDPRDPEALGVAVAEALLERGAGDILDEVRGEPPAVTAP